MGLAEEDTVPTSRSADGPPGWYGKLSTLGDFAQRRLPAHWVQRTDAWLSELMRDLPAVLGPRWLETYLTAPVLRFAWAPGVVDAQWWFGLLMPSCDSVGRYFPLLIIQPRPRAPEDRIALDHLELWFEHVAQAAVRTLDNDAQSLDTLEAELQEAPPWPTPSALPGPGRWATLHQRLHALASQSLQERLNGHTLWWRTATEGDDDRLDILRGLPDGAAFAALLEGGEAAA